MKPQWGNVLRSAPFCPNRAGLLLRQWFSSEQGQFMLRGELELLQQLDYRLSGYHLMQLSYAAEQQPFYCFEHNHCFSLSAHVDNPGSVVTEYETLPLPSETIDTGLLHHVLEFSDNPHRILNDASRVIVPGGHLVLVMFNPISLLGVLKWPTKLFSNAAIWHYRNLRSGRIVDWLKLLHFQPLLLRTGNLLFPARCENAVPTVENVFSKLGEAGILLGAVTIIVARKTLLRPTFGNGVPQRAKHAVGLKLQHTHKRETPANKVAE